MQHVEHRQRLEEVLERHDGMQTPHKRNAQNGVAESAPEDWYAQLFDADVRVDEHVESAGIDAERHQRQRYQLVDAPPHQLEPAYRACHDARQRPLVERLAGMVDVVHHFLVVHHFEHMLAREERLHHSDEQYHGHHIVIGPHGWFDVGLGMVHHALQTYGERDEHSARDKSEVGRVPPVEPVAIVEQPSHLQPQHTPQQRTHPVDALERNDLRHGMEGACQQSLHKQHDEHERHDEPVHVGPVHVEGKPCGKIASHLNGAEQNDVQYREEYAEVALGCHPQLYGGHTLECALYLGHTAQHAQHPQQRQRHTECSQQIAHHNHGGRRHEQQLVAEAELHAEEYGEVERHTDERGVQTHLHVLAHYTPLAHYIVHGTQIHAVRQLEAERQNDVYPRPYPLGHKVVIHGHGERHGGSASRMLVISVVVHRGYLLTVHSTFMPARNLASFDLSPSRCMRTGMRCSTLTKLPVALSCGMSEKAEPVASLMRSTVPSNSTSGTASALMLTFAPRLIPGSWVSR